MRKEVCDNMKEISAARDDFAKHHLRRFALAKHRTIIGSKLMQLYRPPAKIRSKSDSYRLLIDFFDPISAIRSIVASILIQIWTIYIEYSSTYIENSLI